jgi:hypothetical protein
LIARIWGDIMICNAENLPGKITNNARKFSTRRSCRDSPILKDRNITGRGNRSRQPKPGGVADRYRKIDHPVSGAKEHEPEDAEDQNGKAGGNNHECEDRRPGFGLTRFGRSFDDLTVLLRCHGSLIHLTGRVTREKATPDFD